MRLRALLRQLPFIGAMAFGFGSPRIVFAQSNGARVVAQVAAQQSDAAAANDAVASAKAVQPKVRVAVATRALVRGAVLSADDFEMRDTTVRFASPSDATPVAAGWVARRSFNAGEVLRSPAVEAPAVINANSPVLIQWSDGSVSLTVHGVAQRNGALGERIPVRSDLGKRFDATVVGPGRVRID
ncbi:MAG TPA: flagellar basal body P-ring formation chaperone FlgA [Gemmatimonadaceae bacterium]|jgi:flagella basal body P-ring formation protein FlgA